MDKRSLFLNTHDETPPPKKRRHHPPGFESSFHVNANASPSKPPRRTAATRSSLSTTAHQFTSVFESKRREWGETPTRRLEPPRVALDDCPPEVHAASSDGDPQVHQPHFHRKKRVSASFASFTSTFHMPPPTSEPRSDLPPFKITHTPHQISFPDVLRTRTGEAGRFGLTAIVPRTPMHVLKPPPLKEAVESQSHSPAKNRLPPPGGASHPLGITPISDTDKLKLTSMTSHMTSLKCVVSHLATLKRSGAKVNIKLVPPTLAPESPIGLNATTGVISSTVSHAERAEILANSVRTSRTHEPVNDELAELSRGLELSPQKSGRVHSRKLIKGGLAERAERLLFRSSANFSLWQAAFAKQLEGAKHTKEDIRLRISSILSSTKNTKRPFSDGFPRTTIAKCTEVPQGDVEGKQGPSQERTVVFLFAHHEKISSAVDFKEEKEVCVWRPWQEIELPKRFVPLHLPGLEVRTTPATSGASTIGERTALLCSRFLVLV